MKNYGLRYYFLYRAKIRDRMLYEVVIDEKEYSGLPEALKPTGSVLTIKQGVQDDSPFVPIKGSEATINILCTDDMKYISLFTTDPHKYRVSIYEYRFNAQNIETPILTWRGFLDANSYSEQFARPPYGVTLKAIDGLSSLTNYPFLDDKAERYSGLMSARGLIDKCLEKLNLDLPLSEWIGVHQNTNDTDTLSDIFYDCDDIYQENNNATWGDVLKLCLPYGAQIFQANGTIHIRRTSSLILDARPSAFINSHAAIGITRKALLPLWEGKCDISAKAEINVLPPLNSSIIKLNGNKKKDLIKKFGLFEKQRWGTTDEHMPGFQRNMELIVFENCVQFHLGHDYSGIPETKISCYFIPYLKKTNKIRLKIKITLFNLTTASVSKVGCCLYMLDKNEKPFYWIDSENKWSKSPDNTVNLSIDGSDKNYTNIKRHIDSNLLKGKGFEQTITSIPFDGPIQLYIGTWGFEDTEHYYQLSDAEISIEELTTSPNEIIDEINRNYTEKLTIDLPVGDGVYMPNTALYLSNVMRDATGSPILHTCAPHGGSNSLEIIASDARTFRDNVAYSITGEVQSHLPVDINTLFFDRKFTNRVYYINYLERIVARDLYKLQLTQLMNAGTHRKYTEQFEPMTVSENYNVKMLFAVQTTLFFTADNSLYRIDEEGRVVFVLNGTQLSVFPCVDNLAVGYWDADEKHVLATVNTAGSIVEKIIDSVEFLGVDINDNLHYDSTTKHWTAGKIANTGTLTITIFQGDYSIVSFNEFSDQFISEIVYMPNGFLIKTNKGSCWHNYDIHLDGEIPLVFNGTENDPHDIMAINESFIVYCKRLGDSAFICRRQGLWMDISIIKSVPITPNSWAVISTRYVAIYNGSNTIFVYDDYLGTLTNIPRVVANASHIVIIGNILYVTDPSSWWTYNIASYCLCDDSVLGDTYLRYVLEPAVGAGIIPAGGGSLTVTAKVKTYRQGVLLKTEVVQPVVTGSATGFTVRGNVVTAADRDTVIGGERKIGLSLSYTFAYLGETRTLTAQAEVKQQANGLDSYRALAAAFTCAEQEAGPHNVAAPAVDVTATEVYTSGATRPGVRITSAAIVFAEDGAFDWLTVSEDGRMMLGNNTEAEPREARIEAAVTLGILTTTATATLLQAAGQKQYGGARDLVLTQPDIPAGGGTSTNGRSYAFNYVWTWNGVPESGATVKASDKSPSPYHNVVFSGDVGVASLGTTVKARTQIGKVTMTVHTGIVVAEGDPAVTTLVYQQANARTTVRTLWGTDESMGVIVPAKGGTYSGIVVYAQYNYTSGDYDERAQHSGVRLDNADITWSVREGNVSVTNSGVWTVASRGTTVGNAQNVSIAYTYQGASDYLTRSQAPNYVTGVTLSDVKLMYPVIAASATSAAPSLVGSTTTFTFTSGATSTTTPAGGVYTKKTKSYKLVESKNGFTAVNASTGVLTAQNMGTTLGTRESGVVIRTVQTQFVHDPAYAAGGGVVSNVLTGTATCTQGTNAIDRFKDLVVGLEYAQATAGPSGLMPTVTTSATVVYTSGAEVQAGVTPASLTFSENGVFDWIAVNPNGGVELTNNTSATAREAANGVKVVATLDRVTTTAYATITQAAGQKVYGRIAIPRFTVGDVPAQGDRASAGASYAVSHPWTWNAVAGSGGTETFTSDAPSSDYRVVFTDDVTVISLGTTAKGRTQIGTLTMTVHRGIVAAEGDPSSTAIFWQAANAVTFYSDLAATLTYPGAGAAPGTIRPTITATATEVYTSGAARAGVTVTPSVVYSKDADDTWFTLAADGTVTTQNNTTTTARTASVKAVVTLNGQSTTAYAVTAAGAKVYSEKLVDEVQVGGVNLALDTAADRRWRFWGDGVVCRYLLSDNTPNGEPLIIRFTSTNVGANPELFGVGWGDASSWSQQYFASEYPAEGKNFEYRVSKERKHTAVWIFFNSETTVHHIHVQSGNKPTDWSPAPEDITTTATATITQAAGQKVYNRAMDLVLTMADIPAKGGMTSDYASYAFSYVWTWNGVPESGAMVKATNLNPSPYHNVVFSGDVGVASLGTTVKARTQIGKVTMTVHTGIVVAEGDPAVTTLVYQEANAVTEYSELTVTFSVDDIPAGGGTVSSGRLEYSQDVTYTSEAVYIRTTGAAVTYTPAVTAASLGTKKAARYQKGSLTVTVTLNGKSKTTGKPVYQQANRVERYSVINPILTYPQLPYSATGTTPTLRSTATELYTSGSTFPGVPVTPTSVEYVKNTSATWFTFYPSTGGIVTEENTGKARTVTNAVKATLTFSVGDITQQATAYGTISQDGNSYWG